MRYIDTLRREYRAEYRLRRMRRRDPEGREELVEDFYQEVSSGSPILVEGKHDVRALEAGFGPGNYVLIYRKGITLRAVLQESIELFGRRQIVMTDLDAKGNALAEKIRGIVNDMGGIAILRYRNLLRLFRVQFVESLYDKASEIRAILRLDIPRGSRRI